MKQDGVQEPKLRLLDFNTEEVNKDARIPGSENISLDKLKEAAAHWDKNTPIVTYCSGYDCSASHQAAKELSDMDFKDVSVYAGGTNEWAHLSKENKEAYPLEGEAKMDYLQREVAKPATPEENVPYKTISAEELSKKLQESKA